MYGILNKKTGDLAGFYLKNNKSAQKKVGDIEILPQKW